MNEIANALHSLLAHNIVSFTYQKVNGEIRHAKGTRSIHAAENYTSQYISRPMGEEQPNSYYDVEKMGWRSYKPENLISIDGVLPRTDTEFSKKPTLLNEPPKETKKGELPNREIPTSKPMWDGSADIDINKILGGIFGGFGMPMGNSGKDIIVENPPYNKAEVKVGTPTATEKGIELSLGSVSVEDFAKMVAHYAVDELVSRIKRLTL